MTKRLLTGAAIGALMVLSVPAYADIKIAVAGPMTGGEAAFGDQMRRGAEQAVADINAAGGVNGEQLVLQVGDDACDPRQARSVAEQLAQDGVVFVAGHFCSGSSIPASAVYEEEGIVQISPASTNPDFTDKRPGPGIYRVCGRDDQQGEVAAKYIMDAHKGEKIAILHDRTAYGKGLADATKKNLNDAGVKETLYESYTKGDKDFTALVSKMKAEGIQVVYLGGYHNEGGPILRQMRDQGMDAQMLAGDAFNTEDFWGITGEAGSGMMFTFAPDPTRNPQAAEVVKKFAEKKVNPEGYTLYTYAAIQAWAQAATEAKSTEFDEVVKALDSQTSKTVIGDIQFDDKGDPTEGGYVWYKWEGGKYTQQDNL